MDAKAMQEQLKRESKAVVDELTTLRDEIRLKMHLAGAEGKDAWNKLEPQLSQFEQRVGQAADDSLEELRKAGTELKANLQRFYQGMRKP
ncbi:MAG TPA: hypothetical protein VGQ57_06030 [Polyangiaceae bacterium]|jgi:hypothetical protein|nr:hypothetical protein [Polyangiaceae bacterium]